MRVIRICFLSLIADLLTTNIRRLTPLPLPNGSEGPIKLINSAINMNSNMDERPMTAYDSKAGE